MIRPLANARDDVAELWLARWLAERDRTGELRQRAAGGSYHALMELACWLARHRRLDELREPFRWPVGTAGELARRAMRHR